ncbi:uncharacterized protein LOC141899010 [Tubulanus polymorphus]|uniref:uncharacterized protein LOC141899010 n=1 Tax=Tubulanus polymorphus TaxID=672921 RepID=UPI003DA4FD45
MASSPFVRITFWTLLSTGFVANMTALRRETMYRKVPAGAYPWAELSTNSTDTKLGCASLCTTIIETCVGFTYERAGKECKLWMYTDSGSNANISVTDLAFYADHNPDAVKWPTGTYGLYETDEGCPSSFGFNWQKGERFQKGTSRDAGQFTPGIHFPPGSFSTTDITQRFCMKTSDAIKPVSTEWPAGSYCIFMYKNCPKGLHDGTVEWVDDTSRLNTNTGVFPTGTYDPQRTSINFCCMNDSSAISNPIKLPTDKSFYLFVYGSGTCQSVAGMTATEEQYHFNNFAGPPPNNRPPVPTGCHPKTSGPNLQYHSYNMCYYTANP